MTDGNDAHRNTVRLVALRTLEGVVSGAIVGDWDSGLDLSATDRALHHEIVQGSLRTWRYLEYCTKKHCNKKTPKRRMQNLLCMSAYQLIFLTKVPDYAIFSEAQAIASRLGFSTHEISFVLAVLKRVSENKVRYRDFYYSTLETLENGERIDKFGEEELSVLNATDELVNVLKQGPQGSFSKAVRALASLKKISPVFGWTYPWGDASKIEEISERHDSKVAPLLRSLKPTFARKSRSYDYFSVQSESSQFACRVFADLIIEASKDRPQEAVRVLEPAAGKGGKFFGAIAHLLAFGSSLPSLEWVVSDRSDAQLQFFRKSLERLFAESPGLSSKLRVTELLHDWTGPHETEKFDLVWLDAPCTAFGTAAKHPEVFLTRGAHAKKAAEELGKVQRSLIANSVKQLKKNGVYFYSVCTLTADETLAQKNYLMELRETKSVRCEHALWPGFEPAPRSEGFYFTAV